MTLHDLDVRLPDGDIQLLNPKNQAFLQGAGEPQLGGSGVVLTWVGRAMMALFGALLLLILGFTTMMTVWDSSLATATQATVQHREGDDVTYTFDVDGATVTATQGGWFKPVYGSPGKTIDIRYLNASPSWTLLELNFEKTDWFTFVGIVGFLGILTYAGWALIRDSQRMQRLGEHATHVLPGQLVLEIPGPKGSRNYVYEFTAPDNKTLRGTVPVGAMVRYSVPSPVAVLYANARTHHML
ncbi:MAG: hypothetical protein AAGA48_27130 [Myxococcota bacterium]